MEPEYKQYTIRQYVNKLEEAEEQNRFRIRNNPKKKSFFQKVRTAWKELTK